MDFECVSSAERVFSYTQGSFEDMGARPRELTGARSGTCLTLINDELAPIQKANAAKR